MSPGITWRNGGPLMVGGHIGGSERCCCENPPPPACWDCSDSCSYFFEFTSPEEIAAKTPSVTCGQIGGVGSFGNVAEFPFQSAVPPATSPPFENSSFNIANQGFRNGGTFYASTDLTWIGEVELDSSPGNTSIIVQTGLQVLVYCVQGRPSSPVYATFSGYVTCLSNLPSGGDPEGRRAWQLFFSGEFDIPVGGCQSSPQRSCFGYTDAYKFIATPLTFTINKNGCSLGGSFESDEFLDTDDSAINNLVRTTGEAVRDAFSYTFRITSRHACNNIPADCGVSIEGRTVYFPTNSVAVYDFIVGTPSSNVYDNGLWEFEHLIVGSGTAADPYLFYARKYAENPAGFILEEHNLELFCATDDTVNPPVSRWYVRETVYCSPDFSTLTTDQWISEIPSYPEPAREVPCGSVNAGDPVPVGEPSYERVDGYPITSYGDGCVPPPPIGLRITDLCS